MKYPSIRTHDSISIKKPTWQVVKQTKGLDILSYTIHELQRHDEMPSWVPDWSYFPRVPLGHHIAYDMAPVTSGYSCVEAEFTQASNDVLGVTGVHSATVQEIKGAPPQTRTEAFAALKQWAPQDSNYLPIGDDAEDAYTLTLVQGRVNERYAYFPVWPGYVLSLQEQIEAIFREVGDEERLPDDEERLQGVLSKIYYRVFFTEKGRPLWNGTGGNQASRHHRHHSRLRRTHRPAPLAFHPPPPSHQTLYIHGFWEGESLLGRMPAPLTLRFVKDRTGIVVSRFFNSAMGAETHEVPSLQSLPLPQGWQQLVDVERKLSDLLTVTWFGNESTGEKMNSDPRMRGAKLRERAVKVESFALL